MARNSNGFLSTDTELIGFGGGKEYSGASGIYVDNEQNIISITGDVGKEYNGIEPIVVNNEENLISANSAPIGVQEPLYFVQDDDEAVIIGLSGEYVTPSDIAGKLDTSSFESWQQGQYTNDLTAINQKITEVSSNIPSLEGYATEQWVEDKGYLTEVSIPESATWNETTDTLQSNSATWNTVTDKLDVTAQVISSCETSSIDGETLVTKLNGNEIAVGYAGSARIANIALKDYQGNSFVPFYAKTSALENKLDTTAFSTVSSDFLTAHQSLSDYYTKDETSGKEELAQAFANTPGGDTEVNAYVHNNSASIDGTTSVVQSNSSIWSDITAYQSNSASYLTAHQSLDGYATETLVEETSGAITSLIPTDYYPDTNPSGFISEVPNTYLQNTDLTIVDNKVTEISGVPLSAGDEFPVSADEAVQYVQTNSANIDDTVTSYQTNSGTFLTAHQAISADEWNGCYDNVKTNSGVWGGEALPISSRDGLDLEVDNGTLYIGASALTGSIYAYEQNSASYLVENNFEYDGNNLITAYNGSAFAGQGGGGGDVPTGTMNVSALEYNAVNEISAYNGSAIAQYGAEKQWLVHDDTLVHASNSAQYALGVNLSAVAQLLGVDETVLWENSTGYNGSITASEPLTNFKLIKFYVNSNTAANIACVDFPMTGKNNEKVSFGWFDYWTITATNGVWETGGFGVMSWHTRLNNTGMSAFSISNTRYMGTNRSNNSLDAGDYGVGAPYFYKVVGIGRISG